MTRSVLRSPDPETDRARDGISPKTPLPEAGQPGPPVPVTRALNACGLADGSTRFEPLRGGRSNLLWKFSSNGRSLVCKLYTNRSTPLFPNDPDAEELALRHVSGKALGPEFVTTVKAGGRTVLVYEFVDGERWRSDAAAVGALLARLHAVPPPGGLRTITAEVGGILGLGDWMLSGCGGPDAQRLADLRPRTPDVPAVPPVFLHGDVVPENLVDSPHGLRLIDWQCPACGDPAEDLAMFLSPAMQTLYGGAPLSSADRIRFLDALDDPALAERFAALAPSFHWRMAAYCLWQSVRGETDYLVGFRVESEMLESLT